MNTNKRPYQEVGQRLKQQLTDGVYEIGQRLPPERDIAKMLAVSRTVVREAIIMLELEKLVEVRMGSGTYVLNQPVTHTDNIYDIKLKDDVGPFEMLQARQLLESNIAEFAAIQVTPNDIAKMRSALKLEKYELESYEQGHNSSENGDKCFHFYIAEATQNSVLVEMLKFSWELRANSLMWKTLHDRINTNHYRKEWLLDHEKILIALQKKDPKEAKLAMWQHLENVKNTLFELSDTEDPKFDGYLFNVSPVTNIK